MRLSSGSKVHMGGERLGKALTPSTTTGNFLSLPRSILLLGKGNLYGRAVPWGAPYERLKDPRHGSGSSPRCALTSEACGCSPVRISTPASSAASTATAAASRTAAESRTTSCQAAAMAALWAQHSQSPPVPHPDPSPWLFPAPGPRPLVVPQALAVPSPCTLTPGPWLAPSP